MFGVGVGLVGWEEERTVIEKNDMATGPSQLVNHFDTMRIKFLHNVLVPITKSLRRLLEELEATGRVERPSFVFFTSQVQNFSMTAAA